MAIVMIMEEGSGLAIYRALKNHSARTLHPGLFGLERGDLESALDDFKTRLREELMMKRIIGRND